MTEPNRGPPARFHVSLAGALSDKTPPRQRLPGLIRWPIRLILLPFVILDHLATRVVERFLPLPFRVEGTCLRHGTCCHYILVGLPAWTGRFPVLERLALLWLTEVHGFFPRDFRLEDDQGAPLLVLGCRYLTPRGLCAHHVLRPMVCRRWPRVRWSDRAPPLDMACGYRFVSRHGPVDPAG